MRRCLPSLNCRAEFIRPLCSARRIGDEGHHDYQPKAAVDRGQYPLGSRIKQDAVEPVSDKAQLVTCLSCHLAQTVFQNGERAVRVEFQRSIKTKDAFLEVPLCHSMFRQPAWPDFPFPIKNHHIEHQHGDNVQQGAIQG